MVTAADGEQDRSCDAMHAVVVVEEHGDALTLKLVKALLASPSILFCGWHFLCPVCGTREPCHAVRGGNTSAMGRAVARIFRPPYPVLGKLSLNPCPHASMASFQNQPALQLRPSLPVPSFPWENRGWAAPCRSGGAWRGYCSDTMPRNEIPWRLKRSGR